MSILFLSICQNFMYCITYSSDSGQLLFQEGKHSDNYLFSLCYNYFQVDCVVTTAGGIEEDFIKCMAPTYLGEFSLNGKTLREAGINRIGNLLAPNDNYCKFEDWIMPILDQLLKEQKEEVIMFLLFLSFNKPEAGWCHKPKQTSHTLHCGIYRGSTER